MMGCCSSRQTMEISGGGEMQNIAQKSSINVNNLCSRCTEINWRGIIQQACEAPVRQVIHWPPQDDMSASPQSFEPEESYLLKIEVSELKDNCPVCLLFSALAREEERHGHKVEQFTFQREDAENFYGDANTLYPRPYGTMDYQDPELSIANESWCSDVVLGLAIQESAIGSNDVSRTLRKIDPAKINIDLLKYWVSTCYDQHGKDCNPAESELIPSLRVIDVRTGIIEKAQPRCKYVALSYVWGSSQPPKNNSQNGQGRGLLDIAPETIKDAAWLTEELGYRYIWIDRYCIPQDDPQAKHDQIQRMDLIYQQAELTIIAAAGEGPEFGLPGIGDRKRDAQLSAKVDRDTYLVSTEPMCESFFMSKWITRGWTYQESICSRRCVVFTKKEMFFQCKGTACRETVREPGSKDFFIGRLDEGPISLRGQKLTVWDHIEMYCHRQLSFDSDALNGILGIFRLHQQSEDSVYHFWGIPFSAKDIESVEQGFLASLCWTSEIDPESTTGVREIRRQGFPSWSWTGWKTPIRRVFNEYRRPPPLDGKVSVHFNDGSILGFQDAFERNIKKSEFERLPKFLNIECWTFELQSNVLELCQENPGDGSFDVWVWPAGNSALDEKSRIAMSLSLDGDIPPDLLSNSNGRLLGLVFESREKVIVPRHSLESCEVVADFVIIVMKKGDYYERIGFIQLHHNGLNRISTTTFKRITRHGSSIHSDSSLSFPPINFDDHDVFRIENWLPREFTWREIRIG
ncbi:heterokaryon incompatibility protein-domain-containing protein [Annulohypoxylon truncatum]|uniref:heterokaryon incompatibility protein-domain-containing protein n=1 Tax=Annulohypoxylon truncatum TaxID=327061 RepID=UPI002007E689|nr:heterokaryon incompatibility protein-domain-containing protein [Annulohypoxylon truncatum]KAI1210238.1 heterokaryon incompatibility protein-domain-containing protein [Annulohypoxylon truncatum]